MLLLIVHGAGCWQQQQIASTRVTSGTLPKAQSHLVFFCKQLRCRGGVTAGRQPSRGSHCRRRAGRSGCRRRRCGTPRCSRRRHGLLLLSARNASAASRHDDVSRLFGGVHTSAFCLVAPIVYKRPTHTTDVAGSKEALEQARVQHVRWLWTVHLINIQDWPSLAGHARANRPSDECGACLLCAPLRGSAAMCSVCCVL
jgi:hypothetical protein